MTLRILLGAMLLFVAADSAQAAVPMDSFNSANSALLPETAIRRDDKNADHRGGPAQALVKMAQKSRHSIKPDPDKTVDDPQAK